ncbi:MAG TPA: hypothetical protein VHI95_04685 [Acidimicrobiales bacterium]|nr:hypothetical protein [Acidimicrobiales bacterium]
MQRRGWLVLAALVLIGGCSGNDGSPSGQSASTSVSASARSPGASADVEVQGDAALTAAFEQPDVRCGFPDVDGPSIALLSTPSGLVFRIRVQQGKVTVLVSDDATPSHERDFTGSGVSTFDPATGAHVDSTLTEVPNAAGAGDIGQLTAIKASVDCAGQDPGTSTVTLTGDTPKGPLTNEALETARVECNPSGNEVSVVGVVTINGVKEFIELGLRPDGISVNKLRDSGSNNYISAPGAATVTDTGASASGDAAGQGAAASHVLHVEGDVTCGTPVS